MAELTDFITGIADSIRSAEGSTDKISAQNFANRIESLTGSKNVCSNVIETKLPEDMKGSTSITGAITSNGTVFISSEEFGVRVLDNKTKVFKQLLLNNSYLPSDLFEDSSGNIYITLTSANGEYAIGTYLYDSDRIKLGVKLTIPNSNAYITQWQEIDNIIFAIGNSSTSSQNLLIYNPYFKSFSDANIRRNLCYTGSLGKLLVSKLGNKFLVNVGGSGVTKTFYRFNYETKTFLTSALFSGSYALVNNNSFAWTNIQGRSKYEDDEYLYFIYSNTLYREDKKTGIIITIWTDIGSSAYNNNLRIVNFAKHLIMYSTGNTVSGIRSLDKITLSYKDWYNDGVIRDWDASLITSKGEFFISGGRSGWQVPTSRYNDEEDELYLVVSSTSNHITNFFEFNDGTIIMCNQNQNNNANLYRYDEDIDKFIRQTVPKNGGWRGYFKDKDENEYLKSMPNGSGGVNAGILKYNQDKTFSIFYPTGSGWSMEVYSNKSTFLMGGSASGKNPISNLKVIKITDAVPLALDFSILQGQNIYEGYYYSTPIQNGTDNYMLQSISIDNNDNLLPSTFKLSSLSEPRIIIKNDISCVIIFQDYIVYIGGKFV